jgi:hypothetical protein
VSIVIREPDQTRVTDDAAVHCWRQAFPRAVRVLENRAPDHRRWRFAFRAVSGTAARGLDGARRQWMAAAMRDLATHVVQDPWLRCELAVDVAGVPDFAMPDVLPEWSARDVWSLADREGLPMSYVAAVTALPVRIDDIVDTARMIVDFRRTAVAHRSYARDLQASLTTPDVRDDATLDEHLVRFQIDAQRDAADRWRALARRLMLVTPRVATITGSRA